MSSPALEPDVGDDRPGSFITTLGLWVRPERDVTRGHAELGPQVWASGSDRPRIGALATMIDVVGGLRYEGPVTPTVDLNVQLLDALPSTGRIDLVCRPLKAGRRLFTGEVLVHHRDKPVARSVVTFLNHQFAGHSPPTPRAVNDDGLRFDDWLRPQYVDPHTVVVERTPPITNPSGTIQGGVQATAAELATEWVLNPHGRFIAVDLDIRYLSRLTVGPLAATAEVLRVHDDRAYVQVRLTDAGAGHHLVAHVATVARRMH